MTDRQHAVNEAAAEYRVRPAVSDSELDRLFAASWPEHRARPWTPVLARSLAWVCAYAPGLVGFVNVAWDGGGHAFLLDTTVHPSHRHMGIGTGLVLRAADAVRESGVEWLHVDYEPHLEAFYRGCGFRHTHAGLLHLAPRVPGAGRARE
jgi:GNAT superfamily N-acetyltransferase